MLDEGVFSGEFGANEVKPGFTQSASVLVVKITRGVLSFRWLP